jgi:hypothetical protein
MPPPAPAAWLFRIMARLDYKPVSKQRLPGPVAITVMVYHMEMEKIRVLPLRKTRYSVYPYWIPALNIMKPV